jgi:hypothetical protein
MAQASKRNGEKGEWLMAKVKEAESSRLKADEEKGE